MTAFGPISTAPVSSTVGDLAPIAFLVTDALLVELAEDVDDFLSMQDITDTLTVNLYDVEAPVVLAMRDSTDTLAIIAAIEAAQAQMAVYKAGSDDALIALDDELGQLEHFFSPAGPNHGLIIRADDRARAQAPRVKLYVVGRDRTPVMVGRDRAPIIVGRDVADPAPQPIIVGSDVADRKGEGSGL